MSSLYVGIDAGGTKTRLAYQIDQEEKIYFEDGVAANLKRDGITHTVNVLVDLIQAHCSRVQQNRTLHVCAGVSGAGRKTDQAVLEKEIAEALKADSVTILTDADVAYYAAHKSNSGILIILGTGSIILAKTASGKMVRAGGWGYKIGDEAGGYQLARAGLAAVANALDGGPDTKLSVLFETHHVLSSHDQLITYAYQEDVKIQTLAPLVIEAAAHGDEIASEIISSQLTQFCDRLAWLLHQHPDINPSVKLIGGLSNSDFYCNQLQQMLRAVEPQLEISKLDHDPAYAALMIASLKG